MSGRRGESTSGSGPLGCQQALERLQEFIDRELPDGEYESVERHLDTCRSCFSRKEFESRLKQRLSALSSGDVPVAWRNRIRQLISRF